MMTLFSFVLEFNKQRHITDLVKVAQDELEEIGDLNHHGFFNFYLLISAYSAIDLLKL